MKILTVLIFSGDRLHVNGLLKDITRINNKNLNIRLVDWTENNDLKKKYYDGHNSIRGFDIYKDINRIGFISCQIIKTNLIQKIYKKEKSNLLITQFPQNFIILRIIREFQKWKVLNLNCIFNRVGNLELYSKNPKKYLDRLKSEYRGYLTPIKNNFKHLKKNEIKEIYKIIFFKNIISWLFLSIKYCGKTNTFNDIKQVRKIIDEPYIIKFTLIIFYIYPIFFLNFIRIIRKNFNKVINNK